MRKKRTSILLIILSVFLFASVSFSQNTPAAEDRSADAVDTRAPGVKPVEANEYFQYSATKAAMYDDGTVVFANALVKYELVAVDNALEDKSYYNVKIGTASSGDVEYAAPFELRDEGRTTIEYYSIDKIGNREQRKTYVVTVDNTAPVSRVRTDKPLYEADGKYYVSNSHLFSITSTDNLSGVGRIEYTTDGQNYQEYVRTFNVPEATNSVLRVRSTDNVVNVTDTFIFVNTANNTEIETTGLELAMIVDNTAPEVTITPDRPMEFRDGRNIVYENFRYTIEATDDSSGVARIFYRLDNAKAWEPYERPVELSIYGEHRIEAMAVDNVGNASIPVALHVFVDIVPPPAEVSIDK